MHPIFQSVSKTIIQLILKEPFFGHYLSGMLKSVQTNIHTIRLSLSEQHTIQLEINPAYWESLSEPHRYGVLKHEVLHLVLGHLLKSGEYKQHYIFNIAADLVVNQYIIANQLPDTAITLASFEKIEATNRLKLLAHKSVDYYYEKLLQFYQINAQNASIIEKCFPKISETLQQHENWNYFHKINNIELSFLHSFLDKRLKETYNRLSQKKIDFDYFPKNLVIHLQTLQAKPKKQIDWRRTMRIFSSNSRRTSIKNTLRRPSKRYGTSPGIRIQKKHHLLVVIDTSESIQKEELTVFAHEIQQLWKQSTDLTIIECDAAIQAEYAYNGKLIATIKGRGSTDFNPPIQAANKRIHPDGIIYFTDGHASVPNKLPRMPILWLISANGIDERHSNWAKLPGRTIKLELN